MRLYSGTSKQFIQDNVQNQVAEKLRQAFFDHYRFNPSGGEVRSWRNSLRSMALILQDASLLDHGILLEYQLPLSSKRLDFMICGKDQKGKDNAVVVELKQWEKCREALGDNEVLTWINGVEREVLHPSAQVRQYRSYLQDVHPVFYDSTDPVQLSACSYLHNYNYDQDDILFAEKFQNVLNDCPVFTADGVNRLTEYLGLHLVRGRGIDVLNRVEESKYRPSKKLMEHVSNVIKGRSEYVLLDEQLIVYDSVSARVRKGFHDKKKCIVIVKGGPGTGKSVIAINLMADLLAKGYNAHYATGSKAFTETLRKKIGSRSEVQFKYFNSYVEADSNEIDVLIADEAHRIRETSNSMYTPNAMRSNTSQLEELLEAGKVGVFFIDDNQVVRPNEIGSVAYIRDMALKRGCDYVEYELEAQFRCAGSDAFVNWINNTLGIKKTAHVLWTPDSGFDFQIFNSPDQLEAAIRDKMNNGFSARMTAGFCWPWAKEPNSDGSLVKDVVIGDYARPWNARPEARGLAKGIPKASLWADNPAGIDQVGCIYTAQGFEFDYVGVIFGKDLLYRFDQQDWIGDKAASFDAVVKRSGDQFLELVKNTYRVLLTRGLKGCYVYFLDKETERFFKSRIEKM